MKADPGSLDNLRDIVEPAAVSWWPMAIGWWVLLGLIVFAAGVVGYRSWCAWNAAAYRREALRELHVAGTNAEISEILKRTALVAFPRQSVAALSGDRWCDWLGTTSGTPPADPVRRSLSKGVFGDATESASVELRRFAAGWIKTHRVVGDESVGQGGD